MKRSLVLLLVLLVAVNLLLYVSDRSRYRAFVSMIPELFRRHDPSSRERATQLLEALKPDATPQSSRAFSRKRSAGEGISVDPIDLGSELPLEVKVVEENTGGPLPMARVEVSSADRGVEFQGWTDASGRFRFKNPGGDLKVSVRREGYTSVEKNLSMSSRLWANLERSLVFELSPSAAATGIVTDSWGKPVAGATVFAWRVDKKYGKGRYGETNREGHFSIRLPPGQYAFFAEHEVLGEAESAVVSISRPTSTAPLAMTLRHGIHRIVGHVLNEQGNTVEGAKVTLSYLDDEGRIRPFPHRSASTDDRGRFVFEQLKGGKAQLRASCPGYQPSVQNISLDLDTTVELRLSRTKEAIIKGQPLTRLQPLL